MAYTFDEPKLGLLQIAATDAGIVPPGNGSTAIPTPPTTLGMIVQATDPTYGEGEFILLRGLAGTIVSSVVTYNFVTYQTALLPVTANLGTPVAVAMSANLAATFGWYQISGIAVCAKSVAGSVTTLTGVPVHISATAGLLSVSATTGMQIDGMQTANTASVASTTATLNCVLQRPRLQGVAA